MKLLTSIATTIAIACTVWTAVLFQPAFAEKAAVQSTSQSSELSDSTTTTTSSTRYLRPVVSQTIALDQVGALWGSFESELLSLRDIPATVDSVTVLYEEINADFTHAKVTIGFAVEATSMAPEDIALPTEKSTKSVLPKDSYNQSELVAAWEKIDFARPVNAVIETHFFTALGQLVGSEMVVHYQ